MANPATSTSSVRPDIGDYAGQPGRYVEALRTHLGLSYKKLAEYVKTSTRGAHRQGSENYFYRLCNQQAKLRPELVDGLARALELSDKEADLLAQAANLENAAGNNSRQRGKQLLKMLREDENGDPESTNLAKSLINPLVVAVYTLLGKSRTFSKNLARSVAKQSTSQSTTTGNVRDAFEILEDLEAISPDGDQVVQNLDGQDIQVRADNKLDQGYKSEAMKLFFAAADQWGIDALNQTSSDKRYFHSQVMLVEADKTQEFYRELAQRWQALKQELRLKYESDQGDTVVHLGVRGWPMIEFSPESEQGGTDDA